MLILVVSHSIKPGMVFIYPLNVYSFEFRTISPCQEWKSFFVVCAMRILVTECHVRTLRDIFGSLRRIEIRTLPLPCKWIF